MESIKTGVYLKLSEGVKMTLLRLLQFASIVPSCNCPPGHCCCHNLVAKILGSADGRGDEKEYQQKSQVNIDTTHAFSLLFSIPIINKLPPPPDVVPNVLFCPPSTQSTDCMCGGDSRLQYQADSVPENLKKVTCEGDIRVWNLQDEALVEEFEAPLSGFCSCEIDSESSSKLIILINQEEEYIKKQ